MKKTAVEWLVNVVQSCIVPDYIPKEIVEQAKAMEKEQIIEAYNVGKDEYYMYRTGRNYYNGTFKLE